MNQKSDHNCLDSSLAFTFAKVHYTMKKNAIYYSRWQKMLSIIYSIEFLCSYRVSKAKIVNMPHSKGILKRQRKQMHLNNASGYSILFLVLNTLYYGWEKFNEPFNLVHFSFFWQNEVIYIPQYCLKKGDSTHSWKCFYVYKTFYLQGF